MCKLTRSSAVVETHPPFTGTAASLCASSAGSSATVVLLSVLWFLVEVHSQTEFPHVSFRGVNLTDHGYVDLSLVGTDLGDPGNSVRCHTDLQMCCSSAQGENTRGDWRFPNGDRLQFSGSTPAPDIYEVRGAQRVDLVRRNNADSPSGIYRCEIATSAVNDDNDRSVRDMVYVGLYATGGIVTA